MEEQKNKEVKMEVENGKSEGRLSYDDLKKAASELFNENRQLKASLQQAMETLRSINRLGYLFRVVELANKNSTYSFSEEFVTSCLKEIEDLMTVKVDEEVQKDTEEGN